MEQIDYNQALEQARNDVEAIFEPTTSDHRNLLEEAMCGCVLVAEENLRDQKSGWKNGKLAREMLVYAQKLISFEESHKLIEDCCYRMREVIYKHPRLSIEIMEMELQVCVEEDKELRSRLEDYKYNVSCADRGELDKIKQLSMLKSDPVEWTALWEQVIDDVDMEVAEELKDEPGGMGFCHMVWSVRRRVLSKYGIDWRSPSTMNRGVMFD